MNQEGDGPNGKFFPSSVQTKDGNYIPSDYFLKSQACERCHADIYKQWESSMHHFSSFNNQWYRKSIEYMQDVDGVKPSKWCAGCHDPALLFSGKFDKPIKENVHTPEANAGLSCMMCHSIVHVKSTMGQGDFVLEYPKLHALAASDNPVMRALHDFMVRLNPEPHRRVFLKPFMRDQVPEFCSGCHKVHLDEPLNNYRWLRGFDEYDNWQASGVSGQGARSFYYPANSHDVRRLPHAAGSFQGRRKHQRLRPLASLPWREYCRAHGQRGCHATRNQPQVSSRRPGDRGYFRGFSRFEGERLPRLPPAIPSRSFPRALRSVKKRKVRCRKVPRERPDPSPLRSAAWMPPCAAAMMCLWTSSCAPAKSATSSLAAPWMHSTSGWNSKPLDEKGQTIFWSGKVEDDGKGPVDPGAHFYKSLQIDDHGNPINKRNAWATRAVVYVHLIPPGAADTVHFRMHIPEGTGEHITLHSKLNYRKFQWFNTQFAYAGVEQKPANPADGNPSKSPRATMIVSGRLTVIPLMFPARSRRFPNLRSSRSPRIRKQFAFCRTPRPRPLRRSRW